MMTFRFRLQRVLEFRRTQLQVAESECRRAEAKLNAVQARQTALDLRKTETRNAVARLPSVAGHDLWALPDWYRWTDAEKSRLTRLENASAEELEKRRAAAMEAQRKVRLLEKLHDKRRAEWQGAFDREVEEQAADAFRGRDTRLLR